MAFGAEVEESKGLTNNLADSIKNTFADLAKVFKPSIDAWSDAFETVKQSWNKAKPDFINGANEIKSGFSDLGSYLGGEFVPNIVNSFSTNLAPMIGDIFGFGLEEAGKQFEWFGGSVNTTITDIVIPALERVETVATDVFDIIGSAWDTHGEGLMSSFSTTFETIRGHLDNFYNSTFKPIWDKVLEVFDRVWENGLKPLWDNFVDAVFVIGEELLNLYNAIIAPVVDWIINKIFPIIVKVVNGVIDSVGNVITSISNAASGIIQFIKGIIQFVVGVFTGDWNKAWEGIKNIFRGFWNALKGIIDTLLNTLKGIINFVKGVFVAAWEIAWETIKAVWSVVVSFFKGIWDGIVKVFSVVGSWFKDVFTKAWDGIKNAWGGVKDWFSNLWTSIKNVFGSVKDWFKGIFNDAWKAVQNVFSNWGSFFSGLWSRIKTTFSNLGTNISNAISGAVKSGINGVISKIERTINGAISIINGAITLINYLPGVRVGYVGELSLPRLAKGGVVDSATVAMIGEQGKEAVVPLENNTEWMDRLAERIAAKSNTPTKVVLKVGEKELGWATIGAINGITKQTGGLQLVL
jgi:phage-related protein